MNEITVVYEMKLVDSGDGWVKYYIKVPTTRAGVYDFTFRVYPTNKMLPHKQDFPLVKWIWGALLYLHYLIEELKKEGGSK